MYRKHLEGLFWPSSQTLISVPGRRSTLRMIWKGSFGARALCSWKCPRSHILVSLRDTSDRLHQSRGSSSARNSTPGRYGASAMTSSAAASWPLFLASTPSTMATPSRGSRKPQNVRSTASPTGISSSRLITVVLWPSSVSIFPAQMAPTRMSKRFLSTNRPAHRSPSKIPSTTSGARGRGVNRPQRIFEVHPQVADAIRGGCYDFWSSG